MNNKLAVLGLVLLGATAAEAGWYRVVAGTAPAALVEVAVSSAGANGKWRVYGIAGNTVYEYEWWASSWTQTAIATVGVGNTATGIAAGPGRTDDGLVRLYVSVGSVVNAGTVYEVYYDGQWQSRDLGPPQPTLPLPGPMNNVWVGAGRNDGVRRVYTPNVNGKLYEYSVTMGGVTIGDMAAPPGGLGAANGVTVGAGQSTSTNVFVYGGFQDGSVWQYARSGTAWTITRVGGMGAGYAGTEAAVGVGRPDGLLRVYASGVNPGGGGTWLVGEFTWSGGAWSSGNVAQGAGTAAGGLAPGENWRNQGSSEVYASGAMTLTLSSYTAGVWSADTLYASGSAMRGLDGDHLVAGVHGDGIRRVYAGDDGGVLSEFRYDGVLPTSSITVPAGGAALNNLPSLSGTAGDNLAVRWIRLTIARSDGLYWDGASWTASSTSVLASLGSETASSTWSYAGVSWVSDLTYSLTGLAQDVANNMQSPPSTVTFLFDNIAPAALTNLTADTTGAVEGQVRLTWTAPGNSGAVGTAASYVVRYATYDVVGDTTAWWNTATTYAQAWLPPPSGTTETRLVGGLAPGATYYWAIEARDTVPNQAAFSNNGAAPSRAAQTDVTPPAAVTNLTAAENAQVLLTWTSTGDDGTSGAFTGGYQVRYSSLAADTPDTAPGLSETSFSSAPGSAFRLVLTGLSPRMPYYSWVRLRDERANWSAWSSSASAVATAFVLGQNLLGQQELGGSADPSLILGDYDNDGDLDMITLGADGSGSGKTRLWRNDAGIFVLIPQPAFPAIQHGAAVLADFDRDGDLDLALVGQTDTGRTFLILRNDGGTFVTVQQPLGSGKGLASPAIVAGDIDRDGDVDLIVAGSQGPNTRCKVYRNDGIGNFVLVQEPLGVDLGVSAPSLALGDLDNDGDLDLVVEGRAGAVRRFRVYRNDLGTAGFVLWQEPLGAGTGLSDGALALADVDLDGNLDVVASGTDGTTPRLLYYRNDGSSTAPLNLAQQPMGAGGGLASGGSLALADVDNDGDLDLIASGSDGTNGRVRVFRNDGGGTPWSPSQQPFGTADGVEAGNVAAGDIDGDNDLDLVMLGWSSVQGARLLSVYRSLEAQFGNANAAPGAATAGFASTYPDADAGAGVLRLAWGDGTDAEGGDPDRLYYQVRVGSVAGGRTGVSDRYGTPLLGGFVRPRVGTQNALRIVSAEGTTIYWAVRTVDPGFRRSAESVERSVLVSSAPGTVTSLSALPGGPQGSAILTWTAPGNDGTLGTAVRYLIRYATISINAGNFSASWVGDVAALSPIPAPLEGGSGQSMAVTGLSEGVTYYFALKAWDEVPNESFISNGASTQATVVYPVAPSGLGVANPVMGQQLNLSWTVNAEGDLKDYGVYRATYSGAGATASLRVTFVTSPGTTHQDGGLANGTTYYYRLTARDTTLHESGGSAESSDRPDDTTPPASPTGFTAGGGVAVATLTWAANGEGDLKDYRVWRATASPVGIGGAFSPAAAIAVPGTTHQDAGLTNGTTYYYRLTARDTTGNESDGSAEISARPAATPDTTPPAAPTGVGATNPDLGNLLRLSWGANTEPDLKDYRVYRSTNAGVTLVSSHVVTAIPQPGTTHQDGGLANETTYYYRLTARDISLNESPCSTEVSGLPTNQPPAAPMGLGVVDAPSDQGFRINLSWTTNTEGDLKDYRVRRTTFVGVGTADPVVTTVASPGATHQDAGLVNEATYYYRLTARDTLLNESGLSSEASAIPRDNLAPGSPTAFGVDDPATGGLLTLSWAANTEPELKDYRVFRSTNAGVTIISSLVVTAILAPGTTHQDAGLANGTTYYYRLTARDTSLNESPGSSEVSGRPTDITTPGTPLGLGANDVGTGGRLRLSWMANTEPDLKDYGVYRATWTSPLLNKGLLMRVVAPGTTHQDAGLTNGVTFYYQVAARDTSLNESFGSDEVSAVPSDITPPAAPGSLGVTDPGTGARLRLSWAAVTDEALKDYRIYRSTNAGVTLVSSHVVTAILAPGTTHEDNGLVNGTTAYYQVTVRDVTTNESGGSPEASGRPTDNVAPAIPTGVGAANPGQGNRLALSWTANTEPDLKDYRLWRATASPVGIGGAFSPAAVIAAPGATHQDAGLTDETTYYYRLTARDTGLSESVGSVEASALPRDTIPPVAITALAFSTSTAITSVTLTWTAPGDDGTLGLATAYRIRYATYAVAADTAAWWNGVTVFAPGFTPAPPGSAETRAVTGLAEDATYYIAVRAEDERGNLGGFPAAVAVGETKDLTPPAAIGNLTASSGTLNGTALLTWTAPGDNGTTGQASDYLVGYATYGVAGSTTSWWNAATPYAQTWAPAAPGAAESRTLTGLTPGTTYYFAARARDEAGNTASLSNVSSAAAAAVGIHHFDITGLSTTTMAGSGLGLTLTARTAANAVMADYTGTARFSGTDPQATLPGDTAFAPGDGGVRSFIVGSLVFRSAGGQQMTARDSLLAGASGQSSIVQVSSLPFSQIRVSGMPPDGWVHAGCPISPVIEAVDQWGNRITSHVGTVDLNSDDPQHTLTPPTTTFGPAHAGLITLTNGVVFRTTKLVTLSVTDAPAGLIAASPQVNVAPLSAFRFRVSGLPASLTAGTPGCATLEALTPVGTRYTAYRGTVRFTSTDGKAVLPADTPLAASDLGVKVFTDAVVLKTAGVHSVTVEDPASVDGFGKMTGTQSGITVRAEAPAGSGGQPAVDHFVVEFLDAGGNVTMTIPADTGLEIRVTARDHYGNIITGFNGPVQIALSSGRITPSVVMLQAGAPPPGTRTLVRVEAGREATITVTVNGIPAQTAAGARLSLTVQVTAAARASVGYPNPFDPAAGPATIRYYLSDPGEVDIQIFTLTGAQVRRWTFSADRGSQYHLWDGINGDGSTVESGGYLVLILKRYGDRTEKESVRLAILRR